MNLFQKIAEFFESIFNRGSPEMQKKLQIRKFEAEIKQFQPEIYKNGELTANFAEALRLLYLNTAPVGDLLSSTIASPDGGRAHRFEAQLVLTGYTTESQKIVTGLQYEQRKQEILETTAFTPSQVYERQKKRLDKILQELNSQAFVKIDKDLNNLRQLADLCKFNFITMLQVFDSNFIALDHRYKPSYMNTPLAKLANFIEDLYYQTEGLVISTATVNVIKALARLKYGDNVPSDWLDGIIENIKKINSITKNVIAPSKLKVLICLNKCDPLYKPSSVVYKESAVKRFAETLQNKFKSDEARIKTELKDDKVRQDLNLLFPGSFLLSLNGYNTQLNDKIQQDTAFSFTFITAMQILKTFINTYLSESTRSLLNDIVVEGFFNNPAYKSEFSQAVFAAMEIQDKIKEFEESFCAGKRNDVATIDSYLKNGHKDADFLKKLDLKVKDINNEANRIITKDTNNLNVLHKHITSLLQDAKKPASEIISNLKVLMMSSRNRDNTDMLEQQHNNWEIFFEIMKNYAIITNGK